MRYYLIFLAAILVSVSGCEQSALQEDPTNTIANIEQNRANLSPLFNYVGDIKPAVENSHLRGTAVTRKIKLRSSGTVVLVPDAASCDGFIQVLGSGEGLASHLGRFSIDFSYCTDGINPLSPILGVQTVANGDQLFSQLIAAGEDPEMGPYQDWIYYGGTGRFSDASGSIRLYANIDSENQVWSNRGIGSITY